MTRASGAARHGCAMQTRIVHTPGAQVPPPRPGIGPGGPPGPLLARLLAACCARSGAWHGDCTVWIMALPRLPTLEEHAAEWIWRLDPGEFTAADLRVFNAWLRQNPSHRRAAEEVFGLWLALDALAATRARAAPSTRGHGRNVS